MFPDAAPVCATGIAWREDTPIAPSIEALAELAVQEASRFNAAIPSTASQFATAAPAGVRLTA